MSELRCGPPGARRRRDPDRARRHARLARRGLDAGWAVELRLPLPGLYNVYNALAALSAALRLGVEPSPAVAGLERTEAAFGRVETIAVAGKQTSILLIKNPAGANEVIRTLRLEDEQYGDGEGIHLWIALNDRIADGRDVSWVWDADFELLAGSVASVTCAGTRAPEMAVRLKYAGVDPDRIEVVDASPRRSTRRSPPRPSASSHCPPTPRSSS